MIKLYRFKDIENSKYVLSTDNIDYGIRAITYTDFIYDYSFFQCVETREEVEIIEFHEMLFNKEIKDFLKELKNFLEGIDVSKQVKIKTKTNIILEELEHFLDSIK